MMHRIATVAFLILLSIGEATANDLNDYFSNISKLEFTEAKIIASRFANRKLRYELNQLAELLSSAGQHDPLFFKKQLLDDADSKDKTLSVLKLLNAGYYSLFYDPIKRNAYRNFYHAYRLANETENSVLIKPCIYAFLKYYRVEIAQNSNAYLPYIKHLEKLQSDTTDQLWLTIHKVIFYSKSIEGLNKIYFEEVDRLNEFERTIKSTSPLLAYVYYEKALKYYLQGDWKLASMYYIKTVAQSGDFSFLQTERFLSLIKLMLIASREHKFTLAESYYKQASKQINLADTLRSSYYLNLNGSILLNAEGKNDSAYQLLKKAYEQDFKLDFRRNTLEINRLTVELETQEKENTNLTLKQNSSLLIAALSGVALLCLFVYFAYINLRARNKAQTKEKEIQTMKLEKVLKEQELFGIDSMMEGQDKERQRIANDLHDNLGSLLATIKLHFENIQLIPSSEPHQKALLKKTDLLLNEAYQKVRSMAHAKNAGVSAQEGLLPAVKNFAGKASIINRLLIEVEDNGMDKRLENGIEITMFRIIQELITNIIKHAQATEAIIHLTQHEDSINIMVEDNGIGFDISQIKPFNTMGLYTIQKRIENLGGRVTIDSILHKGTAVIIDVPIV